MKLIADVVHGDTVWVHNEDGLMWEGKIEDEDGFIDVVFDHRQMTFQREPRTRVKLDRDQHLLDTPHLRVHWFGEGTHRDQMEARYFVYTDFDACAKRSWFLRSRRVVIDRMKTADVDVLLTVAELLGVPGPASRAEAE